MGFHCTCSRSLSSWPELFILFYFMLFYWMATKGIVFHCKHNSKIHSYIQSLNPILKILNLNTSKPPQSLFKPFPCNQLATKVQSFPRKSSNTASPIAPHAKDFTWNWGCSSNSPPLKHGDQIPSSPGWQRCQMAGGGGHVETSIWPIHYSF